MDNRYVALWLDEASQTRLRNHGITKMPHMTLIFDDSGILPHITPPPYKDAHLVHTIQSVELWQRGQRQFLVAILNKDSFLPYVQHYEQHGAHYKLGFESHITLWKGDTHETPPDIHNLVGQPLQFDRIGFEM